MADNFTANPGTGGDTFGADDVAGVKYPRSKVGYGADGAYGDVSSANPLPVNVTDGTNPIVIKPLSSAPISADNGVVTQAVIHGRTTAGGGAFVDVKVNPSGALAADVSDSTNVGVVGPVTDAELRASAIDTAPIGANAPFWPSYGAPDEVGSSGLMVDAGGALVTRSAILTDEGTFRVNFANTSLAVSIGTVSIAGNIVTGTGFASSAINYRDYFKLDADTETSWAQVASIDSDTQLTLVSSYVGGSSGAASRSLVMTVTGAGGSHSVASGACTLASGTTSGGGMTIARKVDYAPLVFRTRFSVSQRIANQSVRSGLIDPTPTGRYFARFRLEGTTNTTLVCESGRNPTSAPSAAETESTTVTLPNGLTTAQSLDYRIEVLTESCRFYVNGSLVAEHVRSMPSQFDVMMAGTRIENTAVPASSTSVVVDYMTTKNHNKLEIGVMSDAERIVAAQAPLQEFLYNVAGVITINTVLMTIDCSQLRSLYIHCTSMGTTGVVTPQWSNDPAFGSAITATLISETGATSTTFNAAALRATNVRARYFRLILTTATTAGTTTIRVAASQMDASPIIATQPVSGTVTATVTGGTTLPVTPAQTFTNSAATTNATSTKASAGTVWSVQASNINAAARYLKLYNKASAPTVGTDIPVLTVPLPPGVVTQVNGGSNGIRFGTGIAWALTVSAADSATDAVAASEIKVAIAYT